MAARSLSSGSPAVDELLDGLIPGDNIVWVGDRVPVYEAAERAFVDEAAAHGRVLVVATTGAELRRPRTGGLVVVDATSASPYARPGPLADELERLLAGEPPACIAIDGFGTLARRWGTDEAVEFFVRTCPMMLMHDAVTYWRAPASLGPPALDRMRKVTQCFLELHRDQLTVVKAESRVASLAGRSFHVSVDDGTVKLSADAAAGRLARGLATLRHDLGLTQSQVAQAAGVTPSAISQAESGTRGLSLETLLQLSDRLGVSLDRVVSGNPDAGYRLARHDRSRTLTQHGGVIALNDDAAVGLRAYLVALGGRQSGTPPVEHAGVQLLAVTQGLVQVDVGDDTPVLRAGDSIVASTTAIRAWHNLRREPAGFYWALRD